ncbi:MAG TPA: hypothetical protein VMG41_07230 [Gemmatimonadales bacterium]|nr:hypothetical protein [Gemmatimonadales bacterium]
MRRPSASELVAWTLLGAVVGIAAGLALGEWLGAPDPALARRTLSRLARRPARRLTAAETAEVAVLALESDPELHSLDLRPLAVGSGAVELHGWVPDRRLRTRAARLVAEAHGIEQLVNCVLVHGEDDAARPAPPRNPQSA